MIVFRSLNKDNIEKIVELELNKVAQRLEEHAIVLNATPAALEKLADLGFDPEMGARPLRRVIQQKVEDPLSDSLLSGEFEDNDTILVDLENDEIMLYRGMKESAPPVEAPIASG
jgi:ATP-dependent Clp protease ATP-binding subunit ClpC